MEQTYNPQPGNASTEGQIRTPSSHIPQRGKAATMITMPDTSPAGLAKVGVRVGSLVIHPDGGPSPTSS